MAMALCRNRASCREGVDGDEWLDKVFFYQLVDELDSRDQGGILRVALTPMLAYEAGLRYITLHASPAALHRRAVSRMMQR